MGWLAGVTLCFTLLPAAERDLSGFAAVHGAGLWAPAVGAAAAAGALLLGARRDLRKAGRWGIFALLALLLVQAVVFHPQLPFAAACAVLLALALVYALKGRDGSAPAPLPEPKHGRPRLYGTAAVTAGLAFFVFLSAWGVARVLDLAVPSFDFGLFAQMFHKMKQTGLPLTTLERDGLVSHFTVHLSPILYLLLPFYALCPRPETLPVLQAAVLASAGIPLWLLGRQLGFSPALRLLLCLTLFLHPVYAGGIAYDFHENAFLTPLLFWLFWAAGRRSGAGTAVFALLTAAVKEDAAVYVGVFGLYLFLRGILDRELRWELRAGLNLLAGALGWFFGATAILSRYGEGVMSWRYLNLMDPDSPSLFSVVLTVLICPQKLLFACLGQDKWVYLLQSVGMLLFLPLLTRRYERLTLLIPWILINLMPDYAYQHNLFFQYGFGSLAFLLYASALNLRDLLPRIRVRWLRALPLLAAAAVCAVGFFRLDWPLCKRYVETRRDWGVRIDEIRSRLDALPKDAAVAATTYYTTVLSDRDTVYDVSYASPEHLLEADYVVLEPRYDFLYAAWAEEGEPDAAGLTNLTNFLLSNGFDLCERCDDRLLVYRNPLR